MPARRGTYAFERVDAAGLQPAGALAAGRAPGRCGPRSGSIPTSARSPGTPCWPAATGSARWACGSSRRLGTDNEFERLRDYIEGDDPRHLDWRATARRRKLTVRAHQHNQSQRIIFLIDCGRMMAGDTGGGLSPLDHALNAMLLLAHVALHPARPGGAAGLLRPHPGLRSPGGGPRAIRGWCTRCTTCSPNRVEPRYDRAFLELEKRCRKRSLVVLLTNLFDEVSGQIVAEYLGNLTGRHLPLGVFLRDHDLFALADHAPDQGPGLLPGCGRRRPPELARARPRRPAEPRRADPRRLPGAN